MDDNIVDVELSRIKKLQKASVDMNTAQLKMATLKIIKFTIKGLKKSMKGELKPHIKEDFARYLANLESIIEPIKQIESREQMKTVFDKAVWMIQKILKAFRGDLSSNLE